MQAATGCPGRSTMVESFDQLLGLRLIHAEASHLQLDTLVRPNVTTGYLPVANIHAIFHES